MATYSFLNRCIWNASNTSSSAFIVSSSANNGYTPAQCLDPAVVNGATYHYFAQDGATHQEGDGTFNTATNTLTSTTIRNSSNGGAAVTFSNPPIVYMGGPVSTDMSLTPASANVSLFVAPTGSDTNSGTSASHPFATIQKAQTVAASFDYQNLFTCAVTVADGTYTGTSAEPTVQLTHLVNYPANQYPTLTGNTTTPANCVVSNTANSAMATGWQAFWNVQGFQLKSTSGADYDLIAENYSSLQINHIDFAGSGTLCSAQDHSTISWINGAVTSSTSAAVRGVFAFFYGSIINDGGTWTFSNSPAFSGQFANVGDHSILGSGTYVNGNTVTGQRFDLYNYGVIEFTGTRASFPGNGTCVIAQPAIFLGDSNAFLGAYQITSAAAVNQIALSDGAGNLRLDYNISNADQWSFFNNFTIAGNFTTSIGPKITMVNLTDFTSVYYMFLSTGTTYGLGAGHMGFADIVTGNTVFDLQNTSGTMGLLQNAIVQWATSTTQAGSAPDTGLARNAAGVIEVNNGSAGVFRDAKMNFLRLASGTVAGLPAAGVTGRCGFVTDASTTTFATVVVGGGGNPVPVYDTGAAWRIG